MKTIPSVSVRIISKFNTDTDIEKCGRYSRFPIISFATLEKWIEIFNESTFCRFYITL